MKILPLLLPLTLSVGLVVGGCTSATNKGPISAAAIGAVGAYGSGALPARASRDSSGGGFIYAEHSGN